MTGPREAAFGSWNLKVGRKPPQVCEEVIDFLHVEGLDVLTIQECADYVRPLSGILPRMGYQLAWSDKDRSARETAIIYRSALPTRPAQLYRLGGVKWERRPGNRHLGLHPARSAVSVNVCGTRVLSVHMPPGPFGIGYPRRHAAYVAAGHKVHRIGRHWTRHGHPWVMAGDWNKRRTEVGTWADPSPRWLAHKLGATMEGDGIDYGLASCLGLREYRRHDFGHSDHDPVTFIVTRLWGLS